MNDHLKELLRDLLNHAAKEKCFDVGQAHDLVGVVDDLHDELTRLRKALWALTTEPWIGAAPGLKPYVRDVITSGHVQLDPEVEAEMRAHLKEHEE